MHHSVGILAPLKGLMVLLKGVLVTLVRPYEGAADVSTGSPGKGPVLGSVQQRSRMGHVMMLMGVSCTRRGKKNNEKCFENNEKK